MIYTDHKQLTYALSRTTHPWTGGQCRQLSQVAGITQDMWHIKDTDDGVADTLYGPP
jgi:hypothetical protein